MDIRFKQQNLHTYFRSKDIINLDMEMMRLEREMRLEVQKRKEAPWKARRQETRRIQEQKEERLGKAAMGTLAARTRTWRLREDGDMRSPKRGRDTDWLTAVHTPPSKTSRGEGMPGGISHPVNPSRLGPTISSKVRELTTGTTTPSTQNKVSTQLPPKKVKKWKKKKDGTYGWVTSLAKPGNFNLKASNSSVKGQQLSISRNENESDSGKDNAGSAVGGRLVRGGASGD